MERPSIMYDEAEFGVWKFIDGELVNILIQED
jgi:hypothetical protein